MNDDLFTNTAPPETACPDDLVAALKATGRRAVSLKDELDDCKALHKFLEELISYRDKGWVLHLKALCDREADRLKRLRETGQAWIQSVEDLYRDAMEQSKRMPTMIPTNIERLSNATGIAIDRKSRHPRYFFGKDGFLEARIDDLKLTATISTREGKLATIPADPPAILDSVGVESKRLFGRKYNGPRFLSDIRKAYLAVMKARKDARDGDPIPIREIYAEMTKKTKGYKRDEFLVDLSTLVEQGPAETSGFRFDLQQTKDTQEGILLLGVAGRGMVNLMIFKKSNSTPS
jgi:hypothetical protein